MKALDFFLAVLFFTGLTVTASSQAHDHDKMSAASSKTESFKVFGNCGMCKERIEKTAKAEGATSASWDSKTQMLTVTFDPSKTNKEALAKKIALVGHDTEKYKAPDDVYAKLPGCCHYERSK